MHAQKGFLFKFQIKSQVKIVFCSSLFIFSFLVSFKAKISYTKITLMLSVFEVVVLLLFWSLGFFFGFGYIFFQNSMKLHFQ